MRIAHFLAATISIVYGLVQGAGAPIRVLVWDEQQPAQLGVYSNYLGNEIAAYLSKQEGLKVTSAKLNDPEQGLSKTILDSTDALVWWGHVRHGEIKPATALDIVERIKSGKLGFIALHSAHWSAPFMEAMNELARVNVLNSLPVYERQNAVLVESNLFPQLRRPPAYSERLTPSALFRKSSDGTPVRIGLTLPNCCFPGYRADGKPSRIDVLLPKHPIARNLPKTFKLDQTEMYNEPFHVPPPDEVVLEERWEGGEWFRSGMVWNLGRGRIFYFRPGHETYPVFKNPNALRIVENAVRYVGTKKR